jgi:hypothetical protein
MTEIVQVRQEELKHLYKTIDNLREQVETLKAQTKAGFKTFMVIVPQTGKPYFISDFTQACYLAVELTKSKEPVAVYGVEHLGQTNVSNVVNFKLNDEV